MMEILLTVGVALWAHGEEMRSGCPMETERGPKGNGRFVYRARESGLHSRALTFPWDSGKGRETSYCSSRER